VSPVRVPITKPLFDDDDRRAIAQPLETGWVVQGPQVAEFERRFAAFSRAPHALACTSCTTGLHLALAALGVGPGDEVLVPAFTWVATANVALYCGATPVLCDVDPETFNVVPAEIERRLTPRTRAVIPVHLFGLPADMAAIETLTRPRGIAVVEDAACGFGARIGDRHVGTFGQAGAFSFHPRKALTTGEGGMVTTTDAALDTTMRSLRDHGASKSDHARHGNAGAFLLPEFNLLGFNYRMTDMQGALGVTQMAKADFVQARRTALAARYDALLADLPWLRTPKVPPGVTHGWQSYVCLYAPEEPTLARTAELSARRNALMLRLEERGVSTRQGTHAVHTLTYYAQRYGLHAHDYPGAHRAEGLSLTLPLYPTMTEAEQDYVVEQLRAGGP
jgi:perosamine synthetase